MGVYGIDLGTTNSAIARIGAVAVAWPIKSHELPDWIDTIDR